jgi:hypothetical protein
MDPWDWNEIVVGCASKIVIMCGNRRHDVSFSLQLQPPSVVDGEYNLPLLRKLVYKYGPVPRNVYTAYSRDGAIPFYDQAALETIGQVSQSLGKPKSSFRGKRPERGLFEA